MKKLIIVIFSVLFILVGCSNPAKITKDDLVASGYSDNGANEYVYFGDFWNIYVLMMDLVQLTKLV